MSNKTKQDWGCLHWFILGFAIFAVAIFLLVMLVTPSGGDGSCRSMNVQVSNLVRGHPLRGALRSLSISNEPQRQSYTRVSVDSVSHPGEIRHIGTKPGPGAGPKAPAPAKPNLNKQGPAKPGLGQKPSRAPQKPHKAPKVELDLDDCD